ncbi:MAG: helix-turn-helix transcriptional regulator [Planctomycetales bacterium]|nr:helix-turn-helix transcriptional regulator [Planctomycetales bacterium]
MILQAVPTSNGQPDDLSESDISQLARAFKALGDETRLRIAVYVSQHGKANVRQLCELLQMPQPLVSHHLARMRSAGILDMQPDGRHHLYGINAARLASLMQMLSARKCGAAPCDRFLDCIFG